jgi:hypothetical protein
VKADENKPETAAILNSAEIAAKKIKRAKLRRKIFRASIQPHAKGSNHETKIVRSIHRRSYRTIW